jgi:hypothetical protein
MFKSIRVLFESVALKFLDYINEEEENLDDIDLADLIDRTDLERKIEEHGNELREYINSKNNNIQ